jgi:hypothetical protein
MDVMAATATVPFLGAFGGSWRGSVALKTLLCYGNGAVGRKSLRGARQAFLLVTAMVVIWLMLLAIGRLVLRAA